MEVPRRVRCISPPPDGGPVRDGGGRVRPSGSGGALQLLALVQRGGVLGGALHRQGGDVAQG